MKLNNPHISVVIPVYNSESCLPELYSRLKETLEAITADFEIIMINDGSPGNDWDAILKLAETDKRVKGISFSRNFGQHYAITAGLDYSSGEWVVVMDCDLQDQPEEIGRFYQKALAGFDTVVGKRNNRQDSFTKKFFSKIFYRFFSYLTDTKQNGEIANYGIYHRNVINTVLSMRENLRFFPTMIKWAGFKYTSIDIAHGLRKGGVTGYSFTKLCKLAFNVVIAFSDKPLRLTVKLGLTMSFISFVYALFIVIRALMGIKGIEGWASIFVSVWFISGLIIFILGIIGIYISRIFEEVKKRPIYVVRELSGFNKHYTEGQI